MKTLFKRAVFFLLAMFVLGNTNVGECKTTKDTSLKETLVKVESALATNDTDVDVKKLLAPWQHVKSDPRLNFYMGICYLDEDCFGYDEEKAIALLHRSAEKNDVSAQNWLANIYYKKGLFTSALYWKEQAARQGDILAVMEALQMLRRNVGQWERADEKSDKWLKELIRKERDMQAAKELADVLLDRGEKKAARKYYKRVSNSETSMARVSSMQLAKMSGSIRSQIYWLDKACRLGDNNACVALANTFTTGKLVRKDPYRSAVYKGYVERMRMGDISSYRAYTKYRNTQLYEFGKPMNKFTREDAQKKWRTPDRTSIAKGLHGGKSYSVTCDVYAGIKGLYNELQLCYRNNTLEQYQIFSHLSKRDIARAEKKLTKQFGAPSGLLGSWSIKDRIYQTWLLPDNVVAVLHRKQEQLVTSYYHLPVVVKKNWKIPVANPQPQEPLEPAVTIH